MFASSYAAVGYTKYIYETGTNNVNCYWKFTVTEDRDLNRIVQNFTTKEPWERFWILQIITASVTKSFSHTIVQKRYAPLHSKKIIPMTLHSLKFCVQIPKIKNLKLFEFNVLLVKLFIWGNGRRNNPVKEILLQTICLC